MTRIRVSDTALLRWLDRSGAMDVEAMRQLLASSLQRAHDAACAIDIDRYLIVADGLSYIVDEGVVTTVTEEGGRGQQWRRLRRPEPI